MHWLSILVLGCTDVRGNGDVEEQSRVVDGFDELDVDDAIEAHVDLDEGAVADEVTLEFSADSNLLDRIRANLIGNRLVIDTIGRLDPTRPVRVDLTVPSLDEAAANNGARVSLSGVDQELIRLVANNGAEVTARGTATSLGIDANNGSNIQAGDLRADEVGLDVDNGASATVCAEGDVTGNVDNGGSVEVRCGGATAAVMLRNGGTVTRR